MSKIVIDARESGTSTGRYEDKLIEHLHLLKPTHEIVVLTKSHRVSYINKIAPNFKVVVSDFKEFTFSEQLGFREQINSLKADLVHFGMVQQPILYRGKVVTTIHDLIMTWEKNPIRNPALHKAKQIIYKQVIKSAAKKSISIIAPTKYVKNDIVKFTNQPEKKVFVTYEAADVIKDKPQLVKALSGKDYFFYVGRPFPHKNLERLVDAFKLLSAEKPALILALVGKKDANYDRIESLVKKKQIKNVVFTGFVSDGQLKWMYQNCRAYVFPSLSEGFGLPGLEAMVEGAPLVSSNASCLPEVYSEAAKYFDPLDIHDMYSAIKEVISNNDLRSSLIQMGHMQSKKYTWKRMAEQTLEVYKKALD